MRSRWSLIVLAFDLMGGPLGCGKNNSHSGASQSTDAAAGNHDSAAGAPDVQASCTPEAGPDLPDESFVDSNCDGIDGDADEAVFVAPSGLDGAPGNRGAPLRTIERAIELATSSGKSSVYICNGEYAESVRFVGDSVSLYGGYDCTHDWKRTTDRAILRPASGVPLTVEGVPESITLSQLSVHAPSTYDIGASSIALVALNSTGVVIAHSEITSGNAGPGASGGPPAANQPQQTPAFDAPAVPNDANCVSQSSTTCSLISGGNYCGSFGAGGVGSPRACSGFASLNVNGGNGGRGGNCWLGVSAESGFPGEPATPAGSDYLNGAFGVPGSPATLGFGSVHSGRYFPTNIGADGEPGKPGYAGRGGNGGQSFIQSVQGSVIYLVGGGGGQGGYPGCPGLGGHGGEGGGASIALLAQGTRISSLGSLFVTGGGGAGGPPSHGSAGQPGGLGGRGGTGIGVQPGEQGQTGGNGGAGGYGGGGGGGPSIGIVYDGDAPMLTSTVFSLGKGGVGASGPGGKAADGIAAETYGVRAAIDSGA